MPPLFQRGYPLCSSTNLFGHFGCAFVTNLQVLITNDWNGLVHLVHTSCVEGGSWAVGATRHVRCFCPSL